MGTLFQDLKYGIRMLAKNPGFAAVAVLTLALGIGANTAMFSVVDTVLLKPLPYAEPDRLMTVEEVDTRHGPGTDSLSYPDFFDYRARNHVFEHLITGRDSNMVLTGAGQPQQLDVEFVTWDLFQALGIQPALGRGFLEGEETPGSHVVVLSHGFWQSQFGGDPNMVGRAITLDLKPYTVVGIAPARFSYPVNEPGIQLWTTIAEDRQATANERGARMLTALGRLRPGVSTEQARAGLDAIAGALAKQYPESNTNFPGTFVQPVLETLTGDSRAPLLILLGSVGLVLLIACANIANLLLARTVSRQHEMAVRAAVGASRARMVRQLLTESLLLAAVGGILGTGLANYILGLLVPLGGESIPRLAHATLDGRVLIFSLVLAALTSVIFGMAPALRASRADLSASLGDSGRTTLGHHDRTRGALVVAQVALGLVLVGGAGLLMASLLNLERADLGFKPDHLLTFWFSQPETHDNPDQQMAFYDQLLERMRAIPGVQSAAGVWPLPLGGDAAIVSFNILERPEPQPKRPHARLAFATPAYFSTAGIPLLKGRFFTDHDNSKAPSVVIVNKAFADKYFSGEDIVGKLITTGAGAPGQPDDRKLEIVGVVGNAKLFALDAEPQPMYYFPYKQLPWQSPLVMLRSAVPPRTLESAVREQMHSLDPLVPVFQVRTMDELLSSQITAPRFATLLLGCFAGIALLLTMVGLYGVMAYSVSRRTREIGVRIALGAGRSAVLAMVLKQALLLVALGIALGCAVSIAADRLLRSILFGVSAVNPPVLGLSVLLVAFTGLLAAYIPARRATKVDPMAALRCE